MAGSLVLLVAATHLFRGFSEVISHNPGFDIHHRLIASFDPSLIRYSPEQTRQFYKLLGDAANQLPQVRSATVAYNVPMGTNMQSSTVAPEGYSFPKGQQGAFIFTDTVDENFFRTVGIPVLRGRGFLRSDTARSPLVAVVNQQFLIRYGIKDPIDKRFRLGDASTPWVRIVGVTGTGKYLSLMEPPLEIIYLPESQHFMSRASLILDTEGDPLALADPVRKLVKSLAPGVPVYGIRTMDDLFERRSVKVMHLLNGIVGSVGLIGLGLSLVGLYAVVAYHVARRTREIGIRIAVGADRARVLRLFLKQAGTMGLTGIVIGTFLSIAAARGISAALNVRSFDPVLFFAVIVGLLITTLLAALIPALRASRIDPMQAIRQD